MQKFPADTKMSYTKPFMKWVGGKTQILEQVLQRLPTEMKNYHEPFVGGGSVLLGLLSLQKSGKIQILGTVYASDLNANLITLYKTIQTHPDVLIEEVKKLTTEFASCKGTTVNRKAINREEAFTSPESYYFWIRSQFNALRGVERITPMTAAMLLFLNKICFRGVYREGPRGFNVPFGNYKNPSIMDEEHIRTVSELLQNVVFTTCSFTESLSRVEKGDFVYMDPPYAPETETSFVKYTADGFAASQHAELFALCHTLGEKGVSFVLSNADVKMVKEAFVAPAYETQIISCRRAIHSKNPDSRTNEVLIRNYSA